MNIEGKELKDIELINVKDSGVEIIVTNCDISGISIKRTEFYDTAISISDSNISKCKMSQSYFKESKVSNCQIKGSDLRSTGIRNVSMNDCQIISCKSKKSRINDCDATNVSVKSIKSTEMDVHDMVCNQCEFTDINASISTIGRCKFVDCVFDKIVIEKMYCSDNLFENCTFKDVTLQGKFKKVKFVNIDFTSMDLEHVLFIDCEYENCKYRDDQKGILIDYNLLSDDEIKAMFYAYNEAGKGSNLTDFIKRISKDRWTLDMVRITVDWYIKMTLQRSAINFLDDCVDMYKDDMALWHYQYALALIGEREYLSSIEYVIKAFESSNGIEHEIASYKKLIDVSKSARDILNESFVDRYAKAEQIAEVEKLCAHIEEMYDSLVSFNNSQEGDSEKVSQDIEVNEGDSISITLDDILSEELDILEIMEPVYDKVFFAASNREEFEETISKYTDAQIKILAVIVHDEKVNDSGYFMFYTDINCIYNEIYEGLMMIGADDCAENFKKTMALLGDSIPEDWEARTDILYKITEYDYEEMEDNGLLDPYDEFYQERSANVMELAMKYILDHASEFVID